VNCDDVAGPVRQALLTISALAAAFAGRRLLLGPIKQEPLPVTGSIKRTIIDRRKGNTC